MYKYIDFQKQLGGLGVTWHSLMLSFKGSNLDIGWFDGNPFYLLQINILEARTDYKNKMTGFNIFHVQLMKFVISFSLNWS